MQLQHSLVVDAFLMHTEHVGGNVSLGDGPGRILLGAVADNDTCLSVGMYWRHL